MALRYIESISSITAESLNSLRKNFIELMKTGLDLETFTAGINKNLTDFIYDSMLLAGQAEKDAKYTEGTANIISGYVGIGLAATSFVAGAVSEFKIHRNNRGLKQINDLKTKKSPNSLADGDPSDPMINGESILNDITNVDLRTTKAKPHTEQHIRSTNNTEIGRQIDTQLNNKKIDYQESHNRWSQFEGSLGMLMSTLNQSTSSIAQGYATLGAADKYYLKACYDAGAEVARNIIEGNRSIGQTEHELAMRFYDLASGIDRIMEDLDRHSQLRG